MDAVLAYIGTYTREGGGGIVVLEFCPVAGRFVREVQRLPVEDPSYLARHPGGSVLYCVNEVRVLNGAPTGGVCEFRVEPRTGRLVLLRQWPSGGPTPAHVAVDAAGKWLGVANYRGASVALGRLDRRGRLWELEPRMHFSGNGIHPERQKQSHPHQVVFHDECIWVPDLGLDQVFCSRIDAHRVGPVGLSRLGPGTGPRHLVFHGSGRWCYVLGELSSELSVLAVAAPGETMEPRGRHSTRAGGAQGPNQAGAIKLHPDARWLLCSNRGDDTIAVFRVGGTGGDLELTQVFGSGGHWPRDFSITPDGKWLIVAHQHSGDLTTFPFDPATGRIGPCAGRWPVVAPACVVLAGLDARATDQK